MRLACRITSTGFSTEMCTLYFIIVAVVVSDALNELTCNHIEVKD